MVTNLKLLKETIQKSGMTMTSIALKTEISRETLYNRLSGSGEFKASEIALFKEALHLTNEERDAIFFDV